MTGTISVLEAKGQSTVTEQAETSVGEPYPVGLALPPTRESWGKAQRLSLYLCVCVFVVVLLWRSARAHYFYFWRPSDSASSGEGRQALLCIKIFTDKILSTVGLAESLIN